MLDEASYVWIADIKLFRSIAPICTVGYMSFEAFVLSRWKLVYTQGGSV